MQITFIRHGETTGNTAHVWQGHGDSPLTERGRVQARALGRRPAMAGFDRVIASDLGRVLETARLAGLDPDPDPAWREIDLGRWEGLTSEQIEERFPEDFARLRAGDDIGVLGGETSSELAGRIDAGVAAIRERAGDAGHVAVLTHGGVIQTLVARHLGLEGRPRPSVFDRIANTALTTIEYGAEGPVMRVFNDASHDPSPAAVPEGSTVVALIRHGETEANVDGRWQGITDGPLTDRGRRQAAALAAAYDGFAHVYSSDLQRARDTAGALVAASGVGLTVRPELHELHFGEWEDLTPAEMQHRWREQWEAIYVHHRDEPRGRTGETAEQMGRRIAAEVAAIAAAHPGRRVAAVSHGGAIRAYAAGLVGLPFDNRSHLAIAGNTEVTHVRVGPEGSALVSYNMRPGR